MLNWPIRSQIALNWDK